MMGFLSGDTLEVGGSLVAPSAATTTDGLCVTPPNGLPSYNRVVLDTLLGEGRITVNEYNRVKAGLLSIVDLSINSEELARLRCDLSGNSSAYDAHFDPELRPMITNVPATVNVAFASGTKPTDKVHRLTVQTTSTGILTGATACRVNFAFEYEDDGGVVAPVVQVICEDQPTLEWTVQNVTSQHYELVSRNGMALGITATIGVTVSPSRR